MIGLNRSILFNSVRRPKIQDLENFRVWNRLIPFHDFTSFIIIFITELCPNTWAKKGSKNNFPDPGRHLTQNLTFSKFRVSFVIGFDFV